MKNRILTMLRQAGGILSGEEMSARLGISRVSVWKHVRMLRDRGYRIEAGPKGYLLAKEEDVLYPWEFGLREKSVHYFSETGSTMDVARDLARKGSPHMTVVIAERQTSGRGRLARVWQSQQGGLYFTVIVRPELPLSLSFRVNFAASLVFAKVLQETHGIEAKVKWPNDILVGDRKICGMLSEMETESEQIAFINLGIGLNVNNDVRAVTPPAVSLKELLGHSLERKEILRAFLDGFEDRIRNAAEEDVIPEWKRYAGTLNRRVAIKTTQGDHEGLAVDVDESGALILEDDDGQRRKVFYGDCFYQPLKTHDKKMRKGNLHAK